MVMKSLLAMFVTTNKMDLQVAEMTEILDIDNERKSKVKRKQSSLYRRMRKKKTEYANNFTVHGLTRIYNGTRTESIFWLSVLLLGLTFSIYTVHGLVSKYYQYDVYSEVRYIITPKNIFPAFTICEKRRLRKHFLAYCSTNLNDTNDRVCNQSSSITQTKAINYDANKGGKQGNWSNGLFHVIECTTWSGKQCNTNDYLKSSESFPQNCFTLNYDSNLYDPGYGHVRLRFYLNETNENKPASTLVFATLHDPRITEIDLTQEEEFDPDRKYRIKIEKSVIKRLPHPFPSRCSEEKKEDIFPGAYSRRNCLESHLYIDMLQQCGDVFDYHRRYIPDHILKKYRKNITNESFRICSRKLQMKEDRQISDCSFRCEEIVYKTTSSFSEQRKKNTQLPSRSGGGNTTMLYYHLEIQLQEVNSVKTIEEKQLVTWDQVAGEVGGFVGVVIGASLISVIEILCYCALCLSNNIQEKMRKLKRGC